MANWKNITEAPRGSPAGVRRLSDVAKFGGALEVGRRVVGGGVGGVGGGRGEEGGRGRQVRVGLGELKVVGLSKRMAQCNDQWPGWSKCEVGQGEVPRVLKWVSNPPTLWSWQMALCWFSSIPMALLKLEGGRMVEVAALQRVASNNDTLALSLLSGAPLTKTSMTTVLLLPMTMRCVEKVGIWMISFSLVVQIILPGIPIMKTPLDKLVLWNFDPIDCHVKLGKVEADTILPVWAQVRVGASTPTLDVWLTLLQFVNLWQTDRIVTFLTEIHLTLESVTSLS